MKLILFSGFVGSGKTVLILSLAQKIIEENKKNAPNLVIIENEVGAVGIDDKVLKSGGYDVKNLLEGCICCTLQANLVTTLQEVMKNKPEYIIFEPTGLAYPSNIIETVTRFSKMEEVCVVAVVDVSRFSALIKVTPGLITDQIVAASYIILNKCDLATKEKIQEVHRQVEEINKTAPIYEMAAREMVPDGVWSEIL